MKKREEEGGEAMVILTRASFFFLCSELGTAKGFWLLPLVNLLTYLLKGYGMLGQAGSGRLCVLVGLSNLVAK